MSKLFDFIVQLTEFVYQSNRETVQRLYVVEKSSDDKVTK
jgi:hypothetical protein